VAAIEPTAKWPRVRSLGHSGVPGGHRSGAERHAAVGDRGSVFDHQHPLAGQRRSWFEGDRGGGAHDGRVRVGSLDVRDDLCRRVEFGAVELVQHDHVSHSQVDLTRVVGQFVPGRTGSFTGHLRRSWPAVGCGQPAQVIGMVRGLTEVGPCRLQAHQRL